VPPCAPLQHRGCKGRTSEKIIVFDHLTAHNSTVLNNELNWRNTDWAKEASEAKSLLANNQNNKCKWSTKTNTQRLVHPLALAFGIRRRRYKSIVPLEPLDPQSLRLQENSKYKCTRNYAFQLTRRWSHLHVYAAEGLGGHNGNVVYGPFVHIRLSRDVVRWGGKKKGSDSRTFVQLERVNKIAMKEQL